MAVNYKLCYSGDIQALFGLLRKKTGESGDDETLKTTLATLGMTLKCWKTPTGYYRVLKYARNPLQMLYSAQTVAQQLAYHQNQNKLLRDVETDSNATASASIQGRGLYRSVVINDSGNVVAFSPPKTVACNDVADIAALDSLSVSDFTTAFSSVEEFVEGTMITLFYNNSSTDAASATSGWEISTKGVVGGGIFVPKPNTNTNKSGDADTDADAADNSAIQYASAKHTFRSLFLDACIKNGIEFNTLDQRYCYSLVLQHPENPLVCNIQEARLYLIAVYSIDNSTLTVTRHPRSVIDWKSIGFKLPRDYTSGLTDPVFHGIRNRYANPNGASPYRVMGVIINAAGGAGWSFKLRNPAYESAKHTPLESNKRILYEYCNLRRTHDISAHLKLYPEDESKFNDFRDKIISFTKLLYSSYIECFVAKKQPLIDYGGYLRPHMYRMHTDIYKVRRTADAITVPTPTSSQASEIATGVVTKARGGNRGLKFQDAVQYVNLMMSPSELFHSLVLIG